MKMRLYYTAEYIRKDDTYEMILGPVSKVEAWDGMRKLQAENPFRCFDILSRLVDVED